MSFYSQHDEVEESLDRANDALDFMKMAIAASIIALLAVIFTFWLMIKHNHHWLWTLMICWAAIILSNIFRYQAKRICPEAFK